MLENLKQLPIYDSLYLHQYLANLSTDRQVANITLITQIYTLAMLGCPDGIGNFITSSNTLTDQERTDILAILAHQ